MEIMENLWQVGGAEYTSVEDAAIYPDPLWRKGCLDRRRPRRRPRQSGEKYFR